MRIKQLLVLKETREGETRVALTPRTIALLPSPQYRILVEEGAGLKAGFSDADYLEAGAEIFILNGDGFPADTLLLRVKRAEKAREQLEPSWFREHTYMIGFLDPLDDPFDHVLAWKEAGISTFSVDIFNSLLVDDPRNMQAAMSRLAGRLSFHDALKRVSSELPNKLTLIGTGPAAMSAALEAQILGIPIQVFGRQEGHRSRFEAIGALYRVVPPEANQVVFMRCFLSEQTIVISAVRTAGKKPPLLIDEESLKSLPKGAVLVDLTVNEGGSIFGSKSDQSVNMYGVSIVHLSGYPKMEPRAASEAYASCMACLLKDILLPSGEILLHHDLLRECWITDRGKCNLADDRLQVKF